MEGGEADPLPARLRRQSNSVSSFSLILLLLRCLPLEAASESATKSVRSVQANGRTLSRQPYQGVGRLCLPMQKLETTSEFFVL